ncbi:MAG TPA: UvrD-helicase domain-containing protein [Gemmataceae bacterium]|jgi:DNA helicase-2/ATP-dependent DNA helicase PcrA|nr:UvrD-helicase domain-containing protein [Gemmataceae bacterium]
MPQGSPFHLLDDLTWSQQEAVTHFEGPLLILAGAGSGKTRVITRRVAWLLSQGVRPANILAITFTNKAAGEMKQRVDALVPGNRVWVSTFHSLGARLLRQYGERIGLDRNFTIYDMDDRNKIVKQALDAAGMDNVKFTPDRIGGAISRAKNQLLTPEKYAQTGNDFFTNTVAQVYAVYQKKLRDANGLDFDDLLYIPALALKLDPDLRTELDARFKFVLIDEYQDTNGAQYQIAKSLSVDHRNICVVGDPDQSIYKWRGSDIRNIMDFERDFPDARVITLDKNYRSTPAILRAASALIENNKQRRKKSLLTDNGEGEPVRVLTFDTGLDEATLVAKRIKEAVQAGRHRYRDVAVFVRMNALTRALEAAFVHQGVPFQIVKGLAFFDRKENRDVLAYLRLLVNPSDNISFLRAVNEPARGVGKVSLEHLQTYAEAGGISLLEAAGQVAKIPAIKGKARDGLRSFHALMAELRAMVDQPPEDVIAAVLDKSGYRDMLKSTADDEDIDRLANVEELITSAKQFTADDGTRTTREFLEQITLASDVDSWDEQQDHVSVMTLHAAKGLEFPVVYIIALEQGILPGERSLNREEDVEEERRVAFVGITRAMKELYLTHARLRDFRGQTLYAIPSMFLEELPSEVVQVELGAHGGRSPAHDAFRGGPKAASSAWADTGIKPLPPPVPYSVTPAGANSDYDAGQIVQHDQYGIGTVTEVGGYGALRKIRIRFAVGGEKTFIADKVKLKVVTKKPGG